MNFRPQPITADFRALSRKRPAFASWLLARLAPLALFASFACSPSAGPKSSAPQTVAVDPADLPSFAQVVDSIQPGVKGGKLIMGMADEPKTFNPPIASDVLSSAVADLLYDRLFDYDRFTQKVKSELADHWEYDADKMRWVFHLREGLQWSDGEPLTADDFLFASEVIFDPKVPSQFRDLLQVGGKPFTFGAPDPFTFIVNVPAVDSTAFLQILNIQALPRHKYGEALKQGRFTEQLNTDTPPADIVASGPFVVKEYISGDRIVFAPNPHYYRYDSRGVQLPYLDQFVMLSVPNFDAMALRFQSGDLDLIEDPIQPQSLSVLQDGQKQGDYTLYNPGLSLRSTHYWFNLKPGGTYRGDSDNRASWEPEHPGDAPPPDILNRDFRYYVDPVKRAWFEQDDFRRACSMATNRPAMIKTVFYGQAAPLFTLDTPANKVWYNPDIPKYDYDPASAARLLDALGMIDRDGDGIREDARGHPIRFLLITNKENTVRERLAVLLQEDLKKIGFGVELQLLDFNNIITRVEDSHDYEACLLGLSSGVPPHPADGSNIFLSNSRMHEWNPSQKSPATPWEAEIDDLYEQFRKTFDETEQKKLYDRIQVLWAGHVPMIHLAVDQLWLAASNRIGNLKPSLLRPYLTHNIEELYIKPEGTTP